MQQSDLSTGDFTIGDWLVQPRLAHIRRGSKVAHVTPRAMAVLVYLGRANGAVVSRNEILDAVWPRLTVTPDALARCLVELRKAFDDGSNEPRLIETIPKIGIRLTQPAFPVEVSPAFESANSSRRGFLSRPRAWAAGGALAAVLLAAGVASWLGRERADAPPTGNAKALEYYLSANDYARRTNRLEALKSQESLYRRAIEEDPSFALAWVQLGRTHTSFFWYGLDRSSQRLTLAEQALRHALELRPGLPEAHLYLADYDFKGRGDATAALAEFAIAERSMTRNPDFYFLRSSVYRRTGQWLLAARDGDSAIALDPRNMVYRRQQHITYAFVRDYARAAQVLDGILSLWPDDATTYVDKAVLALSGRGDTEPADQYEHAAPTPEYRDGLAATYTRWLAAVFDRDYARALAVLDTTAGGAIFNGDLRNSTLPKAALYARTYLLVGQIERGKLEFAAVARGAEQNLARVDSTDSIAQSALYLTLAEARVESGELETGLESMREARRLLPKSADALSGSATQLAAIVRVLIPAHEKDEALRELDDYLSGPGHWAVEGLAADPRLDPLRDDPRFAALLQKYGARAR
jgi:DNA-binding winged helix-turn-helix (wHTH) protein/cytochrome c-type biogenesis protein CcmH/NrfG